MPFSIDIFSDNKFVTTLDGVTFTEWERSNELYVEMENGARFSFKDVEIAGVSDND